jgi:phage terminase large subunit
MSEVEIKELNIGFEYPEIFEPFLEPHRYKVAEGGRGGAKSHFFANLMVQEVFLHGKRGLCCREVQGSIKESVKALIQDKIREQGLSEWFQIKESEILCLCNEGKISFSGLRQQGQDRTAADNLKSYEGYDLCWVEEAQNVSKMSLDLLLPTIRKIGSEFWFSYNRKVDKEPVHEKFVTSENPPPDTVHIYVNWWDNPWFKDSPLYNLMLSDKMNSVDDYRHIWCGLPQEISEANIFKNWEIREFEPTGFEDMRFGSDFGFSPDPCVLLRSWANWDKKELYIDYCLFKTNLDPEQIVTDLFSQVPGTTKNRTLADSARPEIIKLLNRRGFRVQGVKKGPGSIEAGLDWLKQWRIIVHPRCLKSKQNGMREDIVDEFKMYRHKVDMITGIITPTIIDKWNHAIDALRYAWEKEIMQKGSIDYLKLMRADVAPVKAENIAPANTTASKLHGGVRYISPNQFDLRLPDGTILNNMRKI